MRVKSGGVVCRSARVLRCWSGAERRHGRGRLLLAAGGGGSESAAVQGVEAEVAAAFDPLVVLFGEDGADEAVQGVAVGEDADDVGAAADLAVEPFL